MNGLVTARAWNYKPCVLWGCRDSVSPGKVLIEFNQSRSQGANLIDR